MEVYIACRDDLNFNVTGNSKYERQKPISCGEEDNRFYRGLIKLSSGENPLKVGKCEEYDIVIDDGVSREECLGELGAIMDKDKDAEVIMHTLNGSSDPEALLEEEGKNASLIKGLNSKAAVYIVPEDGLPETYVPRCLLG